MSLKDDVQCLVQEMRQKARLYGTMVDRDDVWAWADRLQSVMARVQELEASHYNEQVLLAAMAGESVMQARGYSVVNLAHLIAERAAKAEAKVQELEAERTLAIDALHDHGGVELKQGLGPSIAMSLKSMNATRVALLKRAEAAEAKVQALEREVARLKGYAQHKVGCDHVRPHYGDGGHSITHWPGEKPCTCGLTAHAEGEPTEPPTPFDTGLCCMSRHANAVAPWTCDCPCHSRVHTEGE